MNDKHIWSNAQMSEDPGFRHLELRFERPLQNGESSSNITAWLRVPEATLKAAVDKFADEMAQTTAAGRTSDYKDDKARTRRLYEFLMQSGAMLHRDPAQGPAFSHQTRIPGGGINSHYGYALQYRVRGEPYVQARPLTSLMGVRAADEADAAAGSLPFPDSVRSHIVIDYHAPDKISTTREAHYGFAEDVTVYLLVPRAAMAQAEARWSNTLRQPDERIDSAGIHKRAREIEAFLTEKGAVLHRNPDSGPAYRRMEVGSELVKLYRLNGEPARRSILGLYGVKDVTPRPPLDLPKPW